MADRVTFKNNRGLELVASIMGIEEGKVKPAVIFAHGLRSGKDSPRNIYIAEGLVEKGLCCFLPDFTGHGESGGESYDATVEQFARDLGASLDYISNIKGIDPERIGVCGSSVGGNAALIRAATDRRIKALAMRSAPAEGYYYYADRINIPVLVVQGDADPVMKETLTLYERLPGEKRLALIRGADHLYTNEQHLREARGAIVQWFVEKLGPEDPVNIFKNRKEAGAGLALRLKEYKDKTGVVVLALPRGGAVTGYEVASYLNSPLDVLIIRKLGFPGQPELAIGAVSETGTVVLNDYIISSYGVTQDYIQGEISRQREVIERRIELYRKGQKLPDLTGKTVILVDDGAATGATAKAAVSTLKAGGIGKLVVALPVAPPGTAEELRRMSDELICLKTPYDFMAVGSYYRDFAQVTDDEVVEILEKARARKAIKIA